MMTILFKEMEIIKNLVEKTSHSKLMNYFEQSNAFDFKAEAFLSDPGLLQHKISSVWQHQTFIDRRITGRDCCEDLVGLSASTYLTHDTKWVRVTPTSFIRKAGRGRAGTRAWSPLQKISKAKTSFDGDLVIPARLILTFQENVTAHFDEHGNIFFLNIPKSNATLTCQFDSQEAMDRKYETERSGFIGFYGKKTDHKEEITSHQISSGEILQIALNCGLKSDFFEIYSLNRFMLSKGEITIPVSQISNLVKMDSSLKGQTDEEQKEMSILLKDSVAHRGKIQLQLKNYKESTIKNHQLGAGLMAVVDEVLPHKVGIKHFIIGISILFTILIFGISAAMLYLRHLRKSTQILL
jgi:hypothetical protein